MKAADRAHPSTPESFSDRAVYQCEQALLAIAAADHSVLAQLDPEDFADSLHRMIVGELAAMAAAGHPEGEPRAVLAWFGEPGRARRARLKPAELRQAVWKALLLQPEVTRAHTWYYLRQVRQARVDRAVQMLAAHLGRVRGATAARVITEAAVRLTKLQERVDAVAIPEAGQANAVAQGGASGVCRSGEQLLGVPAGSGDGGPRDCEGESPRAGHPAPVHVVSGLHQVQSGRAVRLLAMALAAATGGEAVAGS